MNVKPFLPAALALCIGASGCTTVSTYRREAVREETELDRMRVEVHRLQERIDAMKMAQEDLYSRLDECSAASGRQAEETRQRLADMDRTIKALNAAREQDRAMIIDSLTQKITGLMQTQSRAAAPTRTMEGYEHVVKSGETLSQISAAYGVKIDRIMRANNLKNADELRVGQTLFIPD